MVQFLWKAVWQFHSKVNIDLAYDPAIPLLGIKPKENENICPHKTFYMNVHSSIIHNIQNVETIQMSIN